MWTSERCWKSRSRDTDRWEASVAFPSDLMKKIITRLPEGLADTNNRQAEIEFPSWRGKKSQKFDLEIQLIPGIKRNLITH